MDIVGLLPQGSDWTLERCSDLVLSLLKSRKTIELLDANLGLLNTAGAYISRERRSEMSSFLELYLALHRSGPALQPEFIEGARSLISVLEGPTTNNLNSISALERKQIANFLNQTKTSLLALTSHSLDDVMNALAAIGINSNNLPGKLVKTRSDDVWDLVLQNEDEFHSRLLRCGANTVEPNPEQKKYLVTLVGDESSFLDKFDLEWAIVSEEFLGVSLKEAKELVLVEQENFPPLIGGEQGFETVDFHSGGTWVVEKDPGLTRAWDRL